MQQYCLLETCRRKYLLRHFGDPDAQKGIDVRRFIGFTFALSMPIQVCQKTCDACKDPKLLSLNLKALATPSSSGRFSRGGGFMSKNGMYEEVDEGLQRLVGCLAHYSTEIPLEFQKADGYVPYNKAAKIEKGFTVPEVFSLLSVRSSSARTGAKGASILWLPCGWRHGISKGRQRRVVPGACVWV